MDETVDLSSFTIPHDVLDLVPRRLVLRRRIVPVAIEHGVLVIGAEDPDDFELLDEVCFICNREVRAIAARGISAAIERYYSD
jgi:hypothetical protein